ncbi:MAG: hypothetical protein JAY85_15160 [Candidatus Thiodiazotropha weberae]|uniref:hypothetical protein n=1 Tax=Candidatus Thiodiazotropha endoloripes TaxID=1818881 RepID=UPI00114CF21C|nr:hypothetical protein [Candidatus Thiodiazotropha endoloripes]MCG7899780.1 hypothetical protein [Candidatus Thiodiazotropha weberae]
MLALKMEIERNKYTRAEYLIYKYVDCFLAPVRTIADCDVDEAFNLPHHNLNTEELTLLLCKLFESANLVAYADQRGYFTPSNDEIISAIKEHGVDSDDYDYKLTTYYGYTSAAIERYRELHTMFANEC